MRHKRKAEYSNSNCLATENEDFLGNRPLSPGFGVIEVVVSILLLAVLGILIAGGLIQNIIANSQNVLSASATQLVTQEALRLQSSVTNCTDLNAAISATTATTQLVLGETRSIEVKAEKLGWSTCGEIASKVYPILLVARSGAETLFSAETLVILK